MICNTSSKQAKSSLLTIPIVSHYEEKGLPKNNSKLCFHEEHLHHCISPCWKIRFDLLFHKKKRYFQIDHNFLKSTSPFLAQSYAYTREHQKHNSSSANFIHIQIKKWCHRWHLYSDDRLIDTILARWMRDSISMSTYRIHQTLIEDSFLWESGTLTPSEISWTWIISHTSNSHVWLFHENESEKWCSPLFTP